MSYFTEQREKQKDIVNVYISKDEKFWAVNGMIERCQELSHRSLFFVNHPRVPQDVSDWHLERAKTLGLISARLLKFNAKNL